MPGDDRFAQAQELLDAGTPKAWVWDEDGRRVVGEVVSAFSGSTKFKDDVPVLILRVDTGELRSVWGTGVLDDKFRRLIHEGLQPGDVIGVEREAQQRMSGGGNEYWPFQVVRVGAPGGNLLGGPAPIQALPQAEEPSYSSYEAQQAVAQEMDAEVVGEPEGW